LIYCALGLRVNIFRRFTQNQKVDRIVGRNLLLAAIGFAKPAIAARKIITLIEIEFFLRSNDHSRSWEKIAK
jgi:hypothetical protein